MRFVTYALTDVPFGEPRLGVEVGGAIIDVQAACIAYADRLHGAPGREIAKAAVPTDLCTYIRRDPILRPHLERAIEEVMGAGAAQAYGKCLFEREQVRLMAPLRDSGKIICVGLNYRDHAEEMGLSIPETPVVFAKYASAIIGPDAPIIHPGAHLTQRLDFEVELAVLIGRGGKGIPEERAMEHVFGYTVANDVSARDLQFETSQWTKGKCLDTFLPLGPAVVTQDAIADPHQLRLTLHVNGETMQSSSTAHMIFSIPQIVSHLSELFRLEPGDLILTGTPPGIGDAQSPPVYLQPGDTVEAEIEGIGVLTNVIAAAQTAA